MKTKKVALIVIMLALGHGYMSCGLTGCASYYQAHERFSESQSKAIQSSSKMIERTYDDQGRIKTESIGNPMAAWAATLMQAPIEPGSGLYTTLQKAFPWAFGVFGMESLKGIATSNKGSSTTTNVDGSGNLVGNQSGTGGIGNPVTTSTETITGIPRE